MLIAAHMHDAIWSAAAERSADAALGGKSNGELAFFQTTE
jgi:hypothetical protein